MSGCGSEAGHQRHRRAGETPCPACKMAHNAYTSHLRVRDPRERTGGAYLPRAVVDVGPRPWTAHAACHGIDPAVFYGDESNSANYAQARLLCAGCPVRTECLEWALEHDEKHGMWGGLAPEERRHMASGISRERNAG